MFDQTILVEVGDTINDLLDRHGESGLIMAAVFEVDCPGKCGENYRLEPDGECICQSCGRKVRSPLLEAGLI